MQTPSVGDASSDGAAINASVATDAGAPQAAELQIIRPGKATWRSVPREQNGFYAVLDGLCSQLAFDTVGNDVVIHYGGQSLGPMVTSLRTGNASFIALRGDRLESIGDPLIVSPTGVAGRSLDDFWVADSTGTRSSEGAVLHRRIGTTWKKYEKDHTNLHAWLDGGIIGTKGWAAAASGELWVEGSAIRPPSKLGSDLLMNPALAAFPTGEIVILGVLASEQGNPAVPRIARTWSPKGGMKQIPFTLLGPDEYPTLLEIAPDEIYVTSDTKVGRWDGTSWKLLGVTKAKISSAMRVASNDLWIRLASGALVRSAPAPAGGLLFNVVPTPEPVAAIGGVSLGAPWMVGNSGKLYKREGEVWTEKTLPPPPFSSSPRVAFKAKSLRVLAPDDVLILGMYWEKATGWTERELHTALLRTKPHQETLRCNEPDPENNNLHVGTGFQSWPPTLTSESAAACPTPFAVLARKSNAAKTAGDWPLIRGALKGHGELGEVSLVEFVSGDRTFVGAKAKDYATAKKLAELAAGRDRLRPEIVCGEPEVARTFKLDTTTGKVAP